MDEKPAAVGAHPPTRAEAERPQRVGTPGREDGARFRPGSEAEDPEALEALARRAQARGDTAQAVRLFEAALSIRERIVGAESPSLAGLLGELGRVYASQGRHDEAEAAYRRALDSAESRDPQLQTLAAQAASDLAQLCQLLGRPEEALSLLQMALQIDERAWGPDHPNVAARLSALGVALRRTGNEAEAQIALERALRIREAVYRPDHPDTTGSLLSLAQLYGDQQRYDEAATLLQQALLIHERSSGAMHPRVALDLAQLGALYVEQLDYRSAEPLYERALAIESEHPWSPVPQVTVGLDHLAREALARGRREVALEIYAWALEVGERSVGPEDANTRFLRGRFEELGEP